MKKKLLLFTATLGLTANISAQETGTDDGFLNAFTAEKAEWAIDYTDEGNSPRDIRTVTLEGDTVVEKMDWKIIRGLPRIGAGFIRVDGQKVIFKPDEEYIEWVYPYTGEEIIVYDFSLEVGDSILVDYDQVIKHEEITVVDSVLLNNGKKHKRLIDYSGESYIEGIGSISASPLFMLMPLVTGNNNNTFVCCHVNGQLLYRNPLYADCDGTPVGNEVIKTPDNLKISMGNNTLQVALDEDKPFDVAIYSLNGVLLKQQNGNLKEAVIPVHSGKGIFVVRVTCDNKTYSRKVYQL